MAITPCESWPARLAFTQPTATALGITPDVVTADGATHAQEVAAAVRKHAGGTVLVVGHSNTIPAIIAALGGPKFPDLCDGVYSSLFVMEIAAPERGATGVKAPVPLVRSQFGAADAPGADQKARAGNRVMML